MKQRIILKHLSTKLYHLEQSRIRDQFSINESGELTNHIDLEVETARDGIACLALAWKLH